MTRYEFHLVYHLLSEFCTVTLSARYFDIIKDRLYTFAPRNHARRSAQTALYRIADALARMLAPILVFTADEIWENLPPDHDRPRVCSSRFAPGSAGIESRILCFQTGNVSSKFGMMFFIRSNKRESANKLAVRWKRE